MTAFHVWLALAILLFLGAVLAAFTVQWFAPLALGVAGVIALIVAFVVRPRGTAERR